MSVGDWERHDVARDMEAYAKMIKARDEKIAELSASVTALQEALRVAVQMGEEANRLRSEAVSAFQTREATIDKLQKEVTYLRSREPTKEELDDLGVCVGAAEDDSRRFRDLPSRKWLNRIGGVT